MKKFVMITPLQPVVKVDGKVTEDKLRMSRYEPVGNQLLHYDRATRFPLMAVINAYAQKGEAIRVIALTPQTQSAAVHFDQLKEELSALQAEKGFLCAGPEEIPIDKLTAKGTRTKSEVEAAILLYDKAGGKRVKGLTQRRQAEQKLFHSLAEGVSVSGTTVTAKTPFKVKVASPNLNIRSGPGTDHLKTGLYTGPGVFTIVEVRNGKGSKVGWGRLMCGLGWISLDHCTVL